MVRSVTAQIRKRVSLSYGVLAGAVLLALFVGLLSGATAGAAAMSLRARHAAHRADSPIPPARGWLGINYIPITPDVATAYTLTVTTGALIVSVTPNSPAAKAGLRENDVVTAVDKQPIDDSTTITDAIKNKKAGDLVQMTILRDGTEHAIDIKLGTMAPGKSGPRTDSPIDDLRSDVTRILSKK